MRLTVERLGHRGDGVSGGIFIPGALPGEEVEGTLQGDRLTDVRILTPVPDRVKPPCPHARSCGGCSMQHAADPLVARWKEGIVQGALAGQGLAAPVRPIVTSPARSRRRATLSGRRTKGGVLVGFHARASDSIIPVPNCHLLHPDLMAAIPAVEDIVRTGGSRSGEVQATVTRSLTGSDIAVTGGKPADATLRTDLAAIVERHSLSRLTWDGEVVAQRAAPVVQLGPARAALPPGTFLQATEHGEDALANAVTESVGAARRVADLFAGCGTFALRLAQRAEVMAAEADPAMVATLQAAARTTPGLHRIDTQTRDLFRRPLEPDEFRGLDAVVIDPPRAGAEAQTERLAHAQVPVIAMVSCNPATFARDARILCDAGYRMDWVQPVDQFRWSPHVELVAQLTRP
jgi:23S rRNA (uracil1939-C5)-methyltransferase